MKICKLKPNKRKILTSTISLTAFGFCRCHCGGGIPDYFQYLPCALRGIASGAIRSRAQRLCSNSRYALLGISLIRGRASYKTHAPVVAEGRISRQRPLGVRHI